MIHPAFPQKESWGDVEVRNSRHLRCPSQAASQSFGGRKIARLLDVTDVSYRAEILDQSSVSFGMSKTLSGFFRCVAGTAHSLSVQISVCGTESGSKNCKLVSRCRQAVPCFEDKPDKLTCHVLAFGVHTFDMR